jgi:hypothetical protein
MSRTTASGRAVPGAIAEASNWIAPRSALRNTNPKTGGSFASGPELSAHRSVSCWNERYKPAKGQAWVLRLSES